jgi:hypothetical protein
MFGRKGLGNAQQTFEEPRRRGFGPNDRVFDSSVWEGEAGAFLRSAGLSPDDPINRLDLQEPVSAQMAEERANLAKVLEAGNAVSPHPLGAFLLLPTQLWFGRFGSFLLKRLDLSPYRPWNVIFVPVGLGDIKALDVPVGIYNHENADFLRTEVMIEMIAELYEGKTSAEAESIAIMLDGCANKFPSLFPPDNQDFSQIVRDARRRVRAFAVFNSDCRFDRESIIASREAYLGSPEVQLIA